MTIRILVGDCRDVLKTLPAASVDSIVTDPPYHLTAGKKGGSGPASVNLESPYGRARVTTGFMGMTWDGGDVAMRPETWAECLRVLKPGGYLLAFSGTRTYHRMACAIEDAGFEIRDQIGWCYASGFPKSLDVSKAIDKAAGAEREVIAAGKPVKRMIPGADQNATGSWIKDNGREFVPTVTEPATDAARQWQGWGTALKPAWEPICVARKPLIGTVAENVQQHGTGALNIDGCRVHVEPGGRPLREVAPPRDDVQYGGNALAGRVDGSLASSKAAGSTDLGRWPANLIHDGSEEVLRAFPDAPGQLATASSSSSSRKDQNVYGAMARGSGGAEPRMDTGSAARFFYCAKADKADRGEGNTHPTVKPGDLMRYLCRLVTPPGGTVLDPFAGSGSTLLAADREGFDAIGIEMNPQYAEMARKRIHGDAPLFAEVGGG